ncbi:hypothetical protein Dvar_17850 [Desulfosarcina variabilis str. Montpellier]|uniref:hypothetical protein n=1 Tax=Desulfosarcina variabilis TaxID=2300 RepID=UPI003AFA17AE
MNKTNASLILKMLIVGLWLTSEALAKDQGNAAAQANNPLANMVAFNIQNYYIGELTESDENANQLWLRYAQPFSIAKTNWLMRASLPINTYPTPPDVSHETGLGDFNVFAAYLLDMPNPALSVGIGPQLTVPTATEDALGSEKWSAGFAQVLFDARSPKFQYGYLLTWQASFAGDDDRAHVNVAAFQPFLFYQLGHGTYLRAAPIWVYNLQNDDYSVPLGVGIGQVIKRDKIVYNIFVEPQFSVADDGPGYPEWQIFLGFNMQFLN